MCSSRSYSKSDGGQGHTTNPSPSTPYMFARVIGIRPAPIAIDTIGVHPLYHLGRELLPLGDIREVIGIGIAPIAVHISTNVPSQTTSVLVRQPLLSLLDSMTPSQANSGRLRREGYTTTYGFVLV